MSIRINGVVYGSNANQTGTELSENVEGTYSLNEFNSNYNGDIGTYYLAHNPNLFEPMRSNNFKLMIMGLNNVRRAGVADDETGPYATFPLAEDLITVSVQSTFVPNFTQQAIEIKRGNGTVKFAGNPTFSSGNNIVIHDYVGAELKDIFLAWQNLSYNTRTQKVGLASDYKKEAKLIEYSPDMQPLRTWAIHGCWISSLKFDEFSNENSSNQKINVTIEYDSAEIDVSSLDESYGQV